MTKKIFITLTLLLSFTIGCQTTQQQKETKLIVAENWLNSNKGKSSMNISGTWVDQAFASWGTPQFTQIKNNIYGTMGFYNVKGVIRANKVYMIALSNGKVYYTIILEKADKNTLLGKHIDGLNQNENFIGSSFILKRK